MYLACPMCEASYTVGPQQYHFTRRALWGTKSFCKNEVYFKTVVKGYNHNGTDRSGITFNLPSLANVNDLVAWKTSQTFLITSLTDDSKIYAVYSELCPPICAVPKSPLQYAMKAWRPAIQHTGPVTGMQSTIVDLSGNQKIVLHCNCALMLLTENLCIFIYSEAWNNMWLTKTQLSSLAKYLAVKRHSCILIC